MEMTVARNVDVRQSRGDAPAWQSEQQAFEKEWSRALTLEEFDQLCNQKLKEIYG